MCITMTIEGFKLKLSLLHIYIRIIRRVGVNTAKLTGAAYIGISAAFARILLYTNASYYISVVQCEANLVEIPCRVIRHLGDIISVDASL